MRKVESIECVRLKRDAARQNLGFSSGPFVLCGLPVKRPAPGCLLHERRNGQFPLPVTGALARLQEILDAIGIKTLVTLSA